MSWLNLENKVAVVTGGSSGIGLTVVKELLNDGVKVVVCDINPPECLENDNLFL